jgi:hypothetical protein
MVGLKNLDLGACLTFAVFKTSKVLVTNKKNDKYYQNLTIRYSDLLFFTIEELRGTLRKIFTNHNSDKRITKGRN